MSTSALVLDNYAPAFPRGGSSMGWGSWVSRARSGGHAAPQTPGSCAENCACVLKVLRDNKDTIINVQGAWVHPSADAVLGVCASNWISHIHGSSAPGCSGQPIPPHA